MATIESLQPHAVPHKRRREPRDKNFGHTPLSSGDAKRSAHNIAQWNDYLPTECVRTMVRMGWDYTT